ncbi:unannotated protein [freshwater metagenome]|uniref:(d)CMP kinase n=1 Tax=freshwater metagenome TaxID=449393 RepID=A0A6J6WAJ7_9ZZZZ
MRVIAIDGPAGAGKSTVARACAEALGLEVLNTGAMYRAVTYAAISAGADTSDNNACTKAASSAKIELSDRVLLDGVDISQEIRGALVTSEVSTVSAHPGVREVLVEKQRLWASQHGGAVVEGRDIGTVVFPDALVKVFLTASDSERARRRVIDEQSAGREANFADVEADLARRDATDSGRSISPLVAAKDALILDSTTMAIDEVVETIVREFLKREVLQ